MHLSSLLSLKPCAGIALKLCAGLALLPCAGPTLARDPPRPDDVTARLAQLASSSSADRSAAQRWLAAHLSSADQSAVEAALKAGDAEVRARVVEALASEDRLVAVATTLAVASDPVLASTGREALRESIERWSPGSGAVGLDERALLSVLGTKRTAPLVLDARLASAPLEEAIELLARHAPSGCGIAIDPSCGSDELAGSVTAIEGPFDGLLTEVARRRALVLRGFGLGDDEQAGASAWILVLPRERETANTPDSALSPVPPSAATRIVEWCLTVERDGDPRLRSAAARAIAGCGWPGGAAWLAQRWLARADAAALDGLCLLAGRDRVAPELFDPRAQDALRAELERALALGSVGGRRALRIALALGATGVSSAQGADLLAPALRDLAQLDGRALHARLVEVEARRPTTEAARRALDAVLARPDVAPATSWLALVARSRAAVAPGGAPSFPVPRARELVEWAAANGRLPDLARVVRAEPAFSPEVWRDPGALPPTWDRRMVVFVAHCWLARGEIDVAAAHIGRALSASDGAAREVLARALAELGGDIESAEADRLFARILAADAADPALSLRVVALAGGAGTEELADRVLASIPKTAVAREDLLALAALAAGPRGEPARERLMRSLRGSVAIDDALAALDSAIARLRASRDETLERAFTKSVRELARRSPAELRSRLRVDVWPAPPTAVPVRLGDLDRSFARAGL